MLCNKMWKLHPDFKQEKEVEVSSPGHKQEKDVWKYHILVEYSEDVNRDAVKYIEGEQRRS